MDADALLLQRLRGGDEQAFVALVERYNSSMLRLALSFVPSQAVAEEVVQDTWLALLRDVESLTSAEVCEVLAISEGNQRVLLHRGRSKLRQLLESELGGGKPR